MSSSNQIDPKVLYHAFLVRLWCSSPQGIWRASAEHAQTGERFQFADLESLFLFLHERTHVQKSDFSEKSDFYDPSPTV